MSIVPLEGKQILSNIPGKAAMLLAIVFLGLLAVFTVYYVIASPSVTSSPRTHISNWQYSVASVDRQKTLIWGAADYDNSSTAKGKYVIVYMTIKNLDKDKISLGENDFSVVDSKGNLYKEDSYTTIAFDTYRGFTKQGDQINPNAKVTTAVVFDILFPNSSGLTLKSNQTNSPIIKL